MSNSFLALNSDEHDESLGERFLQSAAISLDPSIIRWAEEQSQSCDSTDDPWNLYIHLLARLGIREWLSLRSPRLRNGVEAFSYCPALRSLCSPVEQLDGICWERS